MKLYITGIAGLLGYNIAQQLQVKHEISGIDLVNIGDQSLNYLVSNLEDFTKVEQHILAFKPDVLIHAAAMVNVDACEQYPAKAEFANVHLSGFLADICYKHKIKLIYISTDAVFDGGKSRLYTEDDQTCPLNIYAQTKLNGEQLILTNSNNLVFRTNIFGVNIQNKYSLAEWMYQELLADKTLNLFSDVDFSPILVNELAEIIDKAILANLSGLYHVCATGSITKHNFGLLLKEKGKLKSGHIKAISVDDLNFKAKRAKHMGLDNSKIKRDLGIAISTPGEAIEKFLKLYEVDNGN